MPKALFNIAFTQPNPPSYLKGKDREKYEARRKFYNLTSEYNFFTYALDNKKVVKNKDAEHYFTREGTNGGLFDMNGVLSDEQVAELKEELAKTESIIWHGFISFEEQYNEVFDVQENAVKFLKQTFNVFLERTHLKPKNVRLYASLHDDTDNRHIHFAFFEKQPLRRDKNNELCYTKKGKFEAKAIDNYLVSANMHLDEHGEEYYVARNKAMDALKVVRKDVVTGVKRNTQLNRELNRLIASLPKTGRLQAGSKNMEPLYPQIDLVANLLIASDENARLAHEQMIKELASVKENVVKLVKENKLAYVNNRRMSKDEIEDVMAGRPGLEPKYVDLKNVDYFERLQADYQKRVRGVVMGLCKMIKDGDLRDKKRKYGVNDRSLKIAARRRRGKRVDAIRDIQKMLTEVCKGERANFMKTVKQIERENEYGKAVNG